MIGSKELPFGLLQLSILLFIFRNEKKKEPQKPVGRITANQPRFENILHMRRLVVCYRRFRTTFNSKAVQKDGTDILSRNAGNILPIYAA